MANQKREQSIKNQYPELEWAESLTYWMDGVFKIPGTNFRFGLDPIIGLIPYFGDIVGFGVSGLIMTSAVKRGASGKLIMLMLGNVVVDALVGIVPFFGDIFDFGYKANIRNVALLKAHYHENRHQGSAWPFLLGIALVLLGLLWAIVAIAGYIFDAIGSIF